MKNCNECKFINMTEKEQLDTTKDHICTKHGNRVFHNNQHIGYCDFIFPCDECDGKDFVAREERKVYTRPSGRHSAFVSILRDTEEVD